MSEIAVVKERERRSTAGTRMTSLVGQAAKDDDEFWNHSTWVEDEDGSFHESDEESEARKDTFDSDFDDSEDDEDEDDNETKGEAAVLLEERRQKRAVGKKKMMDVISAGRQLMKKRKNATQRKKALSGEGINAGLVLNVPDSLATKTPAPISALSSVVPIGTSVRSQTKVNKVNSTGFSERKSSRTRTATFKMASAKRSLRTSTINSSIQTSLVQKQSSTAISTKGGKKGKRRFTQEELILEAVQITEAENERWILSRKRIQSEEASSGEFSKKFKMGENNIDKKVICKYNSKRGCYNTLTFPSMDHVPEIFVRPHMDEKKRQLLQEQVRKNNICVITGKIAKYRDPKTGKGYHDLAAFKELRRRLSAGEKLEQLHPHSDHESLTHTVSSTLENKRRPKTKKNASQKMSTSSASCDNNVSKPLHMEDVVLTLETQSNAHLEKAEEHTSTSITSSENKNKPVDSNNGASSSEIKVNLDSEKSEEKQPFVKLTNKKSSKSSNNAENNLHSHTKSNKSSSDLEAVMSIDTENPAVLAEAARENCRVSLAVMSDMKTSPAVVSTAQQLNSSKSLNQQNNDQKISQDGSTHNIKRQNVEASISETTKKEVTSIRTEKISTFSSVDQSSDTVSSNTSVEVPQKKNLQKGTNSSLSDPPLKNVDKKQKEKISTVSNNDQSTDSISSKTLDEVPRKKQSQKRMNHLSNNVDEKKLECKKTKSSSNQSNGNQHIPTMQLQYHNSNIAQQFPMDQPSAMNNTSAYNNIVNQLSQFGAMHQYSQPSPLDIASLYAIQQQNIPNTTPMHMQMYYNNMVFGQYPNLSQTQYSEQNNNSNPEDNDKNEKNG